MTTITYGGAVAAPETHRETVPAKKHWFVRFVDKIAESQMRRAQRDIQLYRHLLPSELEAAGGKLNCRQEDYLPFAR